MRPARRTPLDRALGLVTELRPGEGARALTMATAVFVLLCAYYVIKSAREPLLLATGSAELKSYASAAQAAALIGLVPAYGWLSARVGRGPLILGVGAFFVACLLAFAPAVTTLGPAATASREVTAASFGSLGFVFYVWAGVFSLATVAQFWSFANDVYDRDQGNRLFPLIGFGMTAGAAAGALLPGWLRAHFDADVSTMLRVAAGLVVLHLALMFAVHRAALGDTDDDGTRASSQPLRPSGGFALVLEDRYLRLIAGFVLLLNVVNALGEFLLSDVVLRQALAGQASGEIADVGAYIGSFYEGFFFWVNVATLVVQTFAVSRVVRFGGIAAVLFALPLVSLGAYTMLAAGVAGFALFRVAKMAENTTDYSLMNTGKALLWLPTSREAKYQAKQAVDTLFVRLGDLLQAALVFVCLQLFALEPRQLAGVNVALVLVWLGLTARLVRLSRDRDAALAPAE
ncbi:MAG: translocase [Myxococcales bacterium]|nr:translocase [Myxococcales bacterium]MCB9521479.1 translocase [Myxococcales bacterium]MCB9531761.1 translocase [Myxococcales bacterium]